MQSMKDKKKRKNLKMKKKIIEPKPTSNNYSLSTEDIVYRLDQAIKDIRETKKELKAVLIALTEHGHHVRIIEK